MIEGRGSCLSRKIIIKKKGRNAIRAVCIAVVKILVPISTSLGFEKKKKKKKVHVENTKICKRAAAPIVVFIGDF